MKGIRIIAKVDGFRRAGMAHHGTKEYPADAFSAEQLEQLRNEPRLVVQDCELPDPAPEAAPGVENTEEVGPSEDSGEPALPGKGKSKKS